MRSNRPYVQLDPAVIEQARQMDLLSYLQRYEPDNLKHVARNVYCTREHDSLKISNGKWYWWSRGFGGVSALDYLIKVKEYSFVEAVEALSGITAGWSPPPVSVPKDEPKELLLPPRNKDCDRVIQYLFGRGIDLQIIQECIADGTIYESCSLVIPLASRAFLIACPMGIKSKSKSLFLSSISSPPCSNIMLLFYCTEVRVLIKRCEISLYKRLYILLGEI